MLLRYSHGMRETVKSRLGHQKKTRRCVGFVRTESPAT
jgi:hypothetical protein